jgi:hypothetical protein
VQLLPKDVCRERHRLRRDDDFGTHPRKRLAYALLAVRVEARGVEEVHAAVVGFLQQVHRVLLGYPLYGQRAKAMLLDNKSCLSECNLRHRILLGGKRQNNRIPTLRQLLLAP